MFGDKNQSNRVGKSIKNDMSPLNERLSYPFPSPNGEAKEKLCKMYERMLIFNIYATGWLAMCYGRHCKRPSFSVQKAVFYSAEGGLSHAERPPFAKPPANVYTPTCLLPYCEPL